VQANSSFARRQEFALNQLTLLLAAVVANGWDLFAIPGSPTGAIGLAQFEPSAFSVAVDGDQLAPRRIKETATRFSSRRRLKGLQFTKR
jgi:membrane-bound lytic murein transglycosylase B